jgi:hypothetical protein
VGRVVHDHEVGVRHELAVVAPELERREAILGAEQFQGWDMELAHRGLELGVAWQPDQPADKRSLLGVDFGWNRCRAHRPPRSRSATPRVGRRSA